MNKSDKKITERCQVLEKIVIDVAKTYFDEWTNDDQKKLIETMIGAAIFYLPQGEKYWTGKISKEAIENLKQDQKTKLTKEHQYPRKIAAKDLLEKHKEISIGKESILHLYESEYGLFNYVLPEENKRLAAFQRDGIFVDIETSYSQAGVELIRISTEELTQLKKKFKEKIQSTKKVSFHKKVELLKKAKPKSAPKAKKTKRKITNKDLGEVKINGNPIIKLKKPNTTTCFKAFVNYCIDAQVTDSNSLVKLISNLPRDPKFGKAIYYNRIVEHNGFFYSTYKGSISKIKQIESIGEELNWNIELK